MPPMPTINIKDILIVALGSDAQSVGMINKKASHGSDCIGGVNQLGMKKKTSSTTFTST